MKKLKNKMFLIIKRLLKVKKILFVFFVLQVFNIAFADDLKTELTSVVDDENLKKEQNLTDDKSLTKGLNSTEDESLTKKLNPLEDESLKKGLNLSEDESLTKGLNPTEDESLEKELNLTEQEKKWLEKHKNILLGIDYDRPPLEFMDKHGKYRGIVSIYVKILNEKLGINIRPLELKLSRIDTINSLVKKEIDIIGEIAFVPELANDKIILTNSYHTCPVAIYTDMKEKAVFGLTSLEGKKIAVVKDRYLSFALKQKIDTINLVLFDNPSEAVEALLKGEVFAYLEDFHVAKMVVDKQQIVNLKQASVIHLNYDLSFAVRSDWKIFADIINKVLDSFGKEEELLVYDELKAIEFETEVDYSLPIKEAVIFVIVLIFILFWTIQIRRQREAFKKSEKKFRSIIEGFKRGYFFYTRDLNNNITYVSPSIKNVLGYQPKDYRINYLDYLTNNKLNSTFKERIKNKIAITSGGQGGFELEMKNKNGENILLEFSEVSRFDVNGNLIGLEGIAHDITIQKKAEEQLKIAKQAADEANKAKGDFLANVSHEIRTPMNAIIGMSHLCLKTVLSLKQKDYLKKISISAKSLLRMINDILDFAKIESRKLEMENIDFDLNEVLNNLNTIVSIKAKEKGIDFSISGLSNVTKYLIGDPLRLGQILINLANNAIKFTEKGGVYLEISEEEKDKDVVVLKFCVKDSGIGLTEEQKSKLFKSFSQADPSTTRKYGGTGLGLAISKRLIEMMDGKIWVESEYGKGSKFIFNAKFKFSKIDFNKIKKEEKDKEEKMESFLTTAKVLLVEDNEFNQQVAQEILEEKAIQVTVSINGKEALKIAKEKIFDLILMDVNMPEMDGLTATKLIREDSKNKNTPILAMTASAMQEDLNECIKSGMNDYITKPIDIKELFKKITKWIKFKEGSNDQILEKNKRLAEGKINENKRESEAKFEIQKDEVEKNEVEKDKIEKTNSFIENKVEEQQKIEQTSKEEQSLVIESLDVKAGLEHVAGNKKLYLKLLDKFFDNQKDVIAKINLAMENNKNDEATRLAHTLKGICGTIGALAEQKLAESLEMEFRKDQHDANKISKLMKNLEQSLNIIFNDINKTLSKDKFVNDEHINYKPIKGKLIKDNSQVIEKNETTMDAKINLNNVERDKLNNIILNLEKFLKDSDTNATKEFEKLNDLLKDRGYDEFLDKLNKKINNYLFEEALEDLKNVKF